MSGDQSRDDQTSEQPPIASVRESTDSVIGQLKRHSTRLWLVTGVCLLLAISLVVLASGARGPQITIHFKQGHGIKPGDGLRHRGIDVGEITLVELNDDLNGVQVEVALEPAAKGLACKGSQFWIERPRVSLSRVSGLETVVGAKYLAVQPGPEDAQPATVFQGMETPLQLLDEDATPITIRFKDGSGLAVGDSVRHRGIVVGEVTAIDLDHQLTGVNVVVRLVGRARRLARGGSQFWVERPVIKVTEIRGLDTLLRGRYIAVLPGPADAEPLSEFVGLDRAPSGELPAGGLEILIEGSQRGGLNQGVPVTYRGLKVGHIVSVGMSTDAASIEARTYIQPAYKNLVRDNSRFWSKSGIDVSIGLTGVELDADSFSSIALGGVAFATPDSPGQPVATGHRFAMASEPEDEWLEWQPRIPVGSHFLPEGLTLPVPLRATLRWQESTLGFKRERQRQGWILPLENDRLLGPRDLLSTVQRAVDRTFLEVGGQQFLLQPEMGGNTDSLAVYSPNGQVAVSQSPWPLVRCRTPKEPEDCVLVTPATASNVPLSVARITMDDGQWLIDPAVPIGADFHGANVLAVQDGSLIGIILSLSGQARIVPIPVELLGN